MKKAETTVVSNTLEARALLVTNSVLKRRRERAAYVLNELPLAHRTRKALLFFAIGCVVLAALSWLSYVPAKSPQSRALPLSTLTRANDVDRFNIDYTVRDRDTLWDIAARYYGNPSPANIRRIRTANPNLPKRDEDLKIGIKLKIPVI